MELVIVEIGSPEWEYMWNLYWPEHVLANIKLLHGCNLEGSSSKLGSSLHWDGPLSFIGVPIYTQLCTRLQPSGPNNQNQKTSSFWQIKKPQTNLELKLIWYLVVSFPRNPQFQYLQ
jgi:hypothetical protein